MIGDNGDENDDDDWRKSRQNSLLVIGDSGKEVPSCQTI
jgi:hypothetical protein